MVNAPAKGENYLVCKTTSKENPPHRVKKQGCSAPQRNYFFFLERDDWFDKDTWVQFDELYEFEASRLLKDRFGGQAEYMADLKNVNTRALLNCILKSHNISEKDLQSARRTLKALQKSLKH